MQPDMQAPFDNHYQIAATVKKIEYVGCVEHYLKSFFSESHIFTQTLPSQLQKLITSSNWSL